MGSKKKCIVPFLGGHIPLEIESDILARLTIKDLLRCQCVCKFWCDEIKSSNFINVYSNRNLNHNNAEYNKSIILYDSTWYKGLYSIDLHPLAIEVKKHSTPSDEKLKLIGSCNGLLCFRDFNVGHQYDKRPCKFYFYNPTTGVCKVKTLEVTIFYSDFGFGYDRKNKDYKLLCIRWPSSKSMIYSLSKDLFKRIENCPSGSKETTIWRSIVFSNNALHLVPYGNQNLTGITGFDLETEKYYKLQLPNCDDLHSWNLADLKGCLHFANNIRNLLDYELEIWIMKLYGVKETWTKLIRISCNQIANNVTDSRNKILAKPYAYCKDGQEIIIDLHSRYRVTKESSMENPRAFFRVDLNSGELRKFETLGLVLADYHGWKGKYDATMYVASQVNPKIPNTFVSYLPSI